MVKVINFIAAPKEPQNLIGTREMFLPDQVFQEIECFLASQSNFEVCIMYIRNILYMKVDEKKNIYIYIVSKDFHWFL